MRSFLKRLFTFIFRRRHRVDDASKTLAQPSTHGPAEVDAAAAEVDSLAIFVETLWRETGGGGAQQ